MAKEIPILFSTPMVQAIMEGRKSQTRRVVKPQPGTFDQKHQVKVSDNISTNRCPYGQSGDLIWVREVHYVYGEWRRNGITPTGKPKWRFHRLGPRFLFDPTGYKIEKNSYRKEGWYKRLARFMPKAAARIWLEVESVGVERLQDISPGDACDEGINYDNIDYGALEGGELQADFENYMWRDDPNYKDYHFPTFASCVDSYQSLWEKINGPGSWEANPWVWVVKFKVCQDKNSKEV